MAMPSTKVMLLNAAASLVAIGAIVGVVRTWMAPAALRPCSERYTTSMVFPLERDGGLLTATDIQARTGGQDAGPAREPGCRPSPEGPGCRSP